MEIVFDTHGNEKQKEAAAAWVDPNVEDIVYGGSKGSGKSYLGVSMTFGDAFIYPETHYFIARKRLNDIRKYTIPSIEEVMQHWKVPRANYRLNGQDNYYELHNGSKVFLLQAKWEPSDPLYARFGSMQMTRGWIEEAGEFPVEAKNNLMASIGRWKNDKYGLRGKLLQTCNPAKNYLYPNYYKLSKEGKLPPHQRFIQALPTDNKMLDKGYLDMLNRTLSKNEKERLLFGNWEYDDDPSALCTYDAIIEMFANDHIYSGQFCITADIARMGSDKAVILVWMGWRIVEVITFDKSKTTEIQQAITTLQSRYQIPNSQVLADEDGVGGGVVDSLGCVGFVNNARALNDENYRNLQSQCGYKLAEKIEQRQIHFAADISQAHKEEIIEELEQLKSYETDKDGKLRILPKEQIKQNIGRSPDWRDALLMRSYFDLDNFIPSAF
jgi:phage terminase large subunit